MSQRIDETKEQFNQRQNRERADRLGYDASRIDKLGRRHAPKEEMEVRAEFLVAYAEEHGPMTVRGLYYQAEVAKLPGIEKDDGSYGKVQR